MAVQKRCFDSAGLVVLAMDIEISVRNSSDSMPVCMMDSCAQPGYFLHEACSLNMRLRCCLQA